MKRIDFEAHQSTKPYIQAMAKVAGKPVPGGKSPFGMTLEERIAVMDEHGVDIQIVSCAGGFERFETETAIEVAQKTNNEFFEWGKQYPGRFLGYATLIPTNVEASIKELERCKFELGFNAWNTHTNFTATYIDEDEYFPLIKRAAELDMFIYLHPGPPNIERLNGLGPLLSGGLGYHVDSCITITRLICKGIFDKLPGLKIMLGHMGEAMPFMIDRIDSMGGQPGAKGIKQAPGSNRAVNEYPVSYYFEKNIYVTTSGNFSKAAFNCTKERLGIDRMLFGTDFPIEDYRRSLDFLNSVGMTQIEAERLFYINAREIFHIE